ncbi:histidine kinase dimerization/phospho-acceptor domain-containing protein [uncultured Oscillibacter sp.]|uniref:sensor histidine kinase n=1 Tax=uncultured Oscillibacter sp. TaxID=876091 RepID=UPI003453410E
MSHEIRTPMNAVIGMAAIAAASIQDQSRVEDCLEKIGCSSKHLPMLINGVLDMSHIESNRVRRIPLSCTSSSTASWRWCIPRPAARGCNSPKRPPASPSTPPMWATPFA